jgi:hypothetical protein
MLSIFRWLALAAVSLLLVGLTPGEVSTGSMGVRVLDEPAVEAPGAWAAVRDTSPEARCLLRIRSAYSGGLVGDGCGVWTDYGVYTAWHVVDGAEAVTIVDSGGREHRAWGWWRVPGLDAAVVRLEAPLPFPGLPIAEAPLTESDFAAASGLAYYGLGADEGRPCRTAGEARMVYRDIGDLGGRFYQFTGPSVMGMSGSPLIAGGKVYGVLSHVTVPPSASYYSPCDRTNTGGFLPPRQGAPAQKSAPPKAVEAECDP